jgi:hypothetical protein
MTAVLFCLNKHARTPSTISLTMAAAHFLTQTLKKRNKTEKDVDFNYLVSPLVVRFTTTYCFAGLKGNGWMKKKSYCIFALSFFSLFYRCADG